MVNSRIGIKIIFFGLILKRHELISQKLMAVAKSEIL